METLTWAPDDMENKGCEVEILDDTDIEGDETVVFRLSDVTGGASVGEQDTTVLNIEDDDGPGELSFTMSSYSVDEDAGVATVDVQRTNGTSGVVEVRCDTTAGGTATDGVDYDATMDVLEWPDGDGANKTCEIPITDDTDGEPDETINLELTNPDGGATVGSPGDAILTIVDDDGIYADGFESGNTDAWDSTVGNGPHVSFRSSTYSVNEGDATASVAVRRTGVPTSGAVSVRCDTSDGGATAGMDYTATMETLSWDPGDVADKICPVPILDDGDVEDDETVNLSLTEVSGAALGLSTATLTILDNDTLGLQGDDAVMLRVVPDAAFECGPVQLAPAVGSGSVRLRVSSVKKYQLELSAGGTVLLDLDTPASVGEVIEISGLSLEQHELGVTVEDRSLAHFSIELTSATPCTAVEVKP